MKKTISRRKFIKDLGTYTAAAGVAGMLPGFTKIASAATAKYLIGINMGGGVDHLAMIQADLGTLASVRPTLFRNMSDPSLIAPLNSHLGVHASFSVLAEQFALGNVAVILRVGYENLTRSHEDAEATYARGVADRNSTTNTGWMNRLAQANFANEPFGAFDFTGGHRTLSTGTYRGTSIKSLSDYNYRNISTQGTIENQFMRDNAFSVMADWTELIHAAQLANQAAWNTVVTTVDVIRNIPVATGYPNTTLGSQLRNIDTVIQGIPQVRLAYARSGNFDTHELQANRFATDLSEYDGALRQFILRMQQTGRWEDTIIYLTTEFGRTTPENGSFGTDHGGSTVGIIISPLVNGGVYGADYSSSEMLQRWTETEYLMTDIYSEMVECMGFDPLPIFGTKTSNLGLFA